MQAHPGSRVWHPAAWRRGWREGQPPPATAGSNWSHCEASCPALPRGRPICCPDRRRLWTLLRRGSSSRSGATLQPTTSWTGANTIRSGRRRCCWPTSTRKSVIDRVSFIPRAIVLRYCRNSRSGFLNAALSLEHRPSLIGNEDRTLMWPSLRGDQLLERVFPRIFRGTFFKFGNIKIKWNGYSILFVLEISWSFSFRQISNIVYIFTRSLVIYIHVSNWIITWK